MLFVMADDWSERKTALAEGSTYRVMREAPSTLSGPSFAVGEEVQLSHVGYSHYDNSHVYIFRSQDGANKSYWLHDDAPLERLTGTFRS